MNIRQLWIDRALFFVAMALGTAALGMLISTYGLVREASTTFHGNLASYASRIESEIVHLLDDLDRFSAETGEITQDQLNLRFDILWGSVNGFQPADAATVDNLQGRKTIEAVRTTLVAIEPYIQNIGLEDAKTIAGLKARLRDLVPATHDLKLAARNRNTLIRAGYWRRQRTQSYFTLAVTLGMILSGILSFARMHAGRRAIREMNTALEDRVRARTRDLERANMRLAREALDRDRDRALTNEREARLAQAAQIAGLGYYIWDTIGNRCEVCSEETAKAYGLTPDEYIESVSAPDGDCKWIHPDDRKMVRRKHRELRAGQSVQLDYRVTAPGGARRLREVARPIFDDDGRVVKEIGTTLDMTGQFETEAQLAEAQRMDSIGKLTGGIAHDFNNLLAVILGNLELIKEVKDEDERQSMIGDAILATLRGRDLTMNMLSFARRAPLDPKRIDLDDVAQDLATLLRRTLPANIAVELDLAPALWAVMADRSLTESALLNLAINARDAMPKGGTLTIATENRHIGRAEAAGLGADVTPGAYVVLTVSDTGVGMAEAVRQKAFDPFFSTKPPGKNSGLGLSMVEGFISQTGGAIQVRSKLGSGTCFRLYFHPVTATVAQRPAPGTQAARAAQPGHRILLAEDDPTVRRTLARQLEQIGFCVVAAADGACAEKVFLSQGPFDLLITDIVMPGKIQGPDLAHRLRRRRHDLPVIYLTGYANETRAGIRPGRPEGILLMKPVSHATLQEAVQKAVSG